jgi:hypothetical protein
MGGLPGIAFLFEFDGFMRRFGDCLRSARLPKLARIDVNFAVLDGPVLFGTQSAARLRPAG